jgi:hypothetical protein
VVVAETDQGRGVLGVIDGFSPKGVETEGDSKTRREFLRKIGYKRYLRTSIKDLFYNRIMLNQNKIIVR